MDHQAKVFAEHVQRVEDGSEECMRSLRSGWGIGREVRW